MLTYNLEDECAMERGFASEVLPENFPFRRYRSKVEGEYGVRLEGWLPGKYTDDGDLVNISNFSTKEVFELWTLVKLGNCRLRLLTDEEWVKARVNIGLPPELPNPASTAASVFPEDDDGEGVPQAGRRSQAASQRHRNAATSSASTSEPTPSMPSTAASNSAIASSQARKRKAPSDATTSRKKSKVAPSQQKKISTRARGRAKPTSAEFITDEMDEGS